MTQMVSQHEMAVPARLYPDPIVEALVEIRFTGTDLGEVIVGRLLDNPKWETYSHSRTAVADIPSPIREADENLRFQPTVELRRPDGQRAIRVGERVISFHVLQSYPGWGVYEQEIAESVAAISKKLSNVKVTRIGFRYINAFVPSQHGVGGIGDLSLTVEVGGLPIQDGLNINYVKHIGDHAITVRLSTSDIMVGAIPPDVSVVADIDLSTRSTFEATSVEEVLAWIKTAHDLEKAEFFSLLPTQVVNQLSQPKQ